jgi:hypothetical protein
MLGGEPGSRGRGTGTGDARYASLASHWAGRMRASLSFLLGRPGPWGAVCLLGAMLPGGCSSPLRTTTPGSGGSAGVSARGGSVGTGGLQPVTISLGLGGRAGTAGVRSFGGSSSSGGTISTGGARSTSTTECTDGRCLITLASGRERIWLGIAVDDANVYWIEQPGWWPMFPGTIDGRVMKVPVNGGTPTLLASGQDFPSSIRVNATGVYWTTWYPGCEEPYVPGSASVMRAPPDGSKTGTVTSPSTLSACIGRPRVTRAATP